MRPRLWLLLLIALLPGCDIDFVAVEDSHQGHARLRSEHGTDLEVALEVSLPGREQPPLVLVGGTPSQGELRDGRWWYRAEPSVDTLAPRVELEVRTEEVLTITLPFLTRSGPASRRQNGDLELPVRYGGAPSDPHVTWRVVLVDSDGQPLVTLHARSAPLPSPIVLSRTLVPPTAVAAEITANRHEELAESPYPFSVGIESAVQVPLEPR